MLKNMAKQLLKLEPGIKYAGYAWLNEYGEVHFEPAQKGSQAGREKLVTRGENYSVHTTKSNILFRLKISREGNLIQRMNNLMQVVNHLIDVIRKYDF